LTDVDMVPKAAIDVDPLKIRYARPVKAKSKIY